MNTSVGIRIIEIEWAVKNNQPFDPSPKKHRRSHSRNERSKGGRRKHRPDPDCQDVPEEGEDDVSSKENVAVKPSPGKRRIKMDEAELGTPPKKRRILRFEE